MNLNSRTDENRFVCCELTVRKARVSVALVPDDTPGRESVVKVVAPPHDVMVAHPKQLIEIFLPGNIPLWRNGIIAVDAYPADL